LPTFLQRDAGRYIPPPRDYEGMLAAVREEVAARFIMDSAIKTKSSTKRAAVADEGESIRGRLADDDDDMRRSEDED
jgi:hypothetical protein